MLQIRKDGERVEERMRGSETGWKIKGEEEGGMPREILELQGAEEDSEDEHVVYGKSDPLCNKRMSTHE